MAPNVVRVGDIEIRSCRRKCSKFDLCNFFPTIDESNWSPYESHLHEHKVASISLVPDPRGGKTISSTPGSVRGPPRRRTCRGASS